jgi:hypothetical protein
MPLIRTTFGLAAFTLLSVLGVPHAENISTATMYMKDHADAAKRRVRLQSADAGLQLGEVDSPDTKGAAIHVYSNDFSDRFCRILPAGADWTLRKGRWKYKHKTTKTALSVKDGKLSVSIGTGVTYSLADDGSQGAVNAVVQFGEGARYCMRCPGNQRDDASAFKGTKCVATPCGGEWIPCRAVAFGPHTCVPGNTADLSDDGCPCTGNLECAGVCPVTAPRYCAGGNTGPHCAPGNALDLSEDGCPCTGNLECKGVCPVTVPPGSFVRRCLS